MYCALLRDARFFRLLVRIDRCEMRRVREQGCPRCGGPLHVGHFQRKARGVGVGPAELPEDFWLRFSLCCGWCRHRLMSASVRFLGRKVYVAAAVVIASFLEGGMDRDSIAVAHGELGVSRATLARWREWWRALTGTSWWGRSRGQLPVDLDEHGLPESLLARFEGKARKRMFRMLLFLRPLSATPIPVPAV